MQDAEPVSAVVSAADLAVPAFAADPAEQVSVVSAAVFAADPVGQVSVVGLAVPVSAAETVLAEQVSADPAVQVYAVGIAPVDPVSAAVAAFAAAAVYSAAVALLVAAEPGQSSVLLLQFCFFPYSLRQLRQSSFPERPTFPSYPFSLLSGLYQLPPKCSYDYAHLS